MLVIVIFFGLGATFVLTRVPGYIRQENRFATWAEIGGYLDDTPATDRRAADRRAGASIRSVVRQRFNIGLIVIFGQALQITLVVAALDGFFVLFGVLAIPADTVAGWTGLDDLNVWVEFELSGRTLVLTEPLVRVSAFLGAFAGMYFTVVLSTDDTYRNEFADDVGPEIRQALAVREAYRVATGDVSRPMLSRFADRVGDRGRRHGRRRRRCSTPSGGRRHPSSPWRCWSPSPTAAAT